MMQLSHTRVGCGGAPKPQMNDGRAPAAGSAAGEVEFNNLRMPREEGMNRAPQVANAFTVNDPHPQDASPLALGKVIGDEFFNLARLKRVQVQRTVNGQFNRLGLVHANN